MSYLNPCVEHDDLGGNRARDVFHVKPIAFWRNGSLRRNVSDWAQGDINFPHVVTESGLMVYAAPNGDRRICPTGETDVWASISSPFIYNGTNWVQPSLGTFSRSGNLLTATTTNVNTYIYHGGHFVKAAFLLKNNWVPLNRQFAFRVGVQGLTRSGGVLSRNGVPVIHLRAPVVYDLDNPQNVRPIAHEFVQLGGQWYVLFTLPSLTGMGRPVVDPTLTLQPDAAEGQDTEILPGAPDFNYGTLDHCNAGSTIRGMLQFDVSSIPAGAVVSSATLTLYCDVEVGEADEAISIHRGLTQWYEGAKNGAPPDALQDGCTWNLRNVNGAVAWAGGAGGGAGTDYTAVATASTTITAPLAYYDWNGLADVSAWHAGTASNYGWWLLGLITLKAFPSSDHATAAYRPKLVVEYTLPGGLLAALNKYSYSGGTLT